MVLSEAVVQRAELQEGGAVVVAQPRGRRQILDGLLWVPDPDVAFGAKLPRLRIPGRDLKKNKNTTGESIILTLFIFLNVLKMGIIQINRPMMPLSAKFTLF